MVDDLGDYDVAPVEGNPFGSMASSPNDFDVAPVDHDPFAGAGENPAPDQFELASRQPPRPEAPAARNMPYPGQFDPSSVYAKPPLDPSDRQDLIRTVYGEASDQPALGQAGVVHAILNRVRAGGYGQGISGVVHAPAAGENPAHGFKEFSPWNAPGVPESNPTAQNLSPDSRDPRLAKAYRDIGTIVDDVYADRIPDPTHGATHYYGYMRHPPKWAAPLAKQNTVRIGGQTFVGRESGPGRSVQTASYAGGGRIGFDDGGVVDLGQADDDTGSQLAPAASPLPAPVPDAPPPMTSADVLARGGLGSISAASFAPSDQARQLVQMGLEGAGMSRGSAQDISGNFSTEVGALPISGQIQSGADALYHAGRGEYGQAALSGVGAVPDVGPLAHATGAMFLGPVARFADREGLGAAKTALQAGEHPYDVWSQHLWERGPGDSWRTEIADPTNTQNWGQHGETKTIGDIYPHPELYANYPGLEHTPVDFIGSEHLPPGAMGAYDENNDRFLMNADLPPGQRAHTVTHELTHSVQMREGWPGGADPAAMEVHKPGTPGNFALNYILGQMTAAQKKAMGRPAIVREAQRFAYETKAGEAQAENTPARLGMSMPDRRAAYPATTEPIPRGNQWWNDPATGKLSFGQDVEPPDDDWDSSVEEATRILSGRASGGPVQLNGDLRRRLALITQPRDGFADGGVTDLGSDDLAVGASPDYVGPEGASGGTGQGSASLYSVGRPGGDGGATGVLGSPGEAPSPLSAFDPIAAEQARAAEAAGRYSPVSGLPQKPIQLKDGSFYVPGPIATAQQAAEDYMRSAGLPYNPPTDYAKLDKDRAGRIAQAFDEMPHAPNDPAVRSSYEALARETMAQYQHVKGTGLKIDYITPEMADPYADNPREAIKDIRDNNHWWVYPTESGYGAEGASAADENPMLRPSGETISGRPTVINDIFRVVHDYFGHAKEGHGFRAEGEDNAWRSHMAMYSPEAVPAATTELRGQNSWLNYGPYGESNRTAKAADTVFADQKLGLMPDWTWKDGGPGAGGAMRPLMAPQLVGRPATSLVGSEEHLLRQREGLEPPGGRPVEWTGGRISFARGGRIRFAGGGPVQLNSDLRRRLALVTQPRHGFADGGAPDDPDAAGFSALDKMTGRADRAAEPAPAPAPAQAANDSSIDPETGLPVFDPATNVPREPQTPVSGGTWGRAAELGYEDIAGKIGEAQDWLGGKLETGVGKTAAAIGVPNAAGLARDVRAAVMESGELGPREMPHEAGIVQGADGILRHADPAFQDGRIATTTPWSKKLPDPHLSGDATIGHDTMQASGDTYQKTADIIKEMPYTGVKTKVPAEAGKKAKTTTTWTPTGDLNIDPNATPEEAHEAFIEHAKSNILALHDAVPDDIRQGSMQWYDGANTIAKQRALTYGKPLENVSGVYAALSPQMDWYKNASLGDRVMDTLHRMGNLSFSDEMQNWADDYLTNSSSADTADSAAIFARIKDIPLGQLTNPLDKAHWIRAYDEAHNSRDYNIVNPDGTFGAPVQTKGGANAGAGWGSMDAIANAVKAYDAKDMPTISEAMGGGHKVRNFYNNILNPNAQTGDVTIDTHAIAAALLRPLSGSDKDTAIGLGTAPPTNAMTGSKGLYGAYAEAYRRAAEERGILPRQMQSITWEAIRGLYSPVQKRSGAFRARVNNAWANHGNGSWTQQEVQRHLMTDPTTGASLIKDPSWYTGSAIEEPE
jgi:hypothetical protein